jgi:uncharacterized membrane protein YkvA (DUF1232 family)
MELRTWARQLKRHSLTIYFVARDPRTPVAVRLLALAVAAYALSPIDLIPDFVPVLGYLDDLIIVPLGIALVMRFVPAEVMATARERADVAASKPVSYGAAAFVVALWLLAAVALGRWLLAWLDT